MSDIVERLRQPEYGKLAFEAAAEIERLSERCEAYKGQVKAGADEIKRLREVVRYWQGLHSMSPRNDIRAATIEECAQIADGYSKAAAKAIRALKEQK